VSRAKTETLPGGDHDLPAPRFYRLHGLQARHASRRNRAEAHFGGKLPDKNLPAYLDISPINFVKKIETPLLALATTGDKIVPVGLNTERFVDLLKANNKTFESKIYDNAPGGHVYLFGDSPETTDTFKRTFDWLGKYLKP